jgi:glycine reductase complex component B subunit alpha and beta
MMRLEMGLVHISDVRFGPRTVMDDHILFIDRQELISLLAQEPLFDSVEIDLAHPGESSRIIRVLDVLEPRYRLNGSNFPGALEEVGLVGEGRTRALKNLCVVESSADQTRGRNIIDMSGPATDYSPFGATHNVVLIPHPAKGADMDEYRLSVKKAGLRAAVYLATAAKEVIPDETQIYELPPTPSTTCPKICRASATSSPSTRSSIRRTRRRRFFTAAIFRDFCRR